MKRTQHTTDSVARVRIQFYDTILDDPTDIAAVLIFYAWTTLTDQKILLFIYWNMFLFCLSFLLLFF